jgi:hypothetical protein
MSKSTKRQRLKAARAKSGASASASAALTARKTSTTKQTTNRRRNDAVSTAVRRGAAMLAETTSTPMDDVAALAEGERRAVAAASLMVEDDADDDGNTAEMTAPTEGRVMRALMAESCVDACVALDAALRAGVEVQPTTCARTLQLCQKHAKAKPALRLLQRMEERGMGANPVAMRCAFFACAKRGMLREALELMSRRDAGNGERYLGKDVLVRACAMTPGGTDGDLGLALLESALRGIAGGSWEPGSTAVIRTQMPFSVGRSGGDAEESGGSAATAATAASYPPGSFKLVCTNDGRRRPVDRLPLELYAPVHPGVIPFDPSGLTQPERYDVPHVAGAFLITNALSRRECAAVIAAGHAIGLKTDPADVDGVTGALRLQYCEFIVWQQTIESLWSRISDLMPAGAVGVNPRWRFFRYGPGTIYRRHVDGSWPANALNDQGEYVVDTSNGKIRSRLTFLIYLTEGFNGGSTTFFGATPGEPGVISARGVVPQIGSVLCFPHGDAEDSPVHEGSAVTQSINGEAYKYVIRTDVFFEK